MTNPDENLFLKISNKYPGKGCVVIIKAELIWTLNAKKIDWTLDYILKFCIKLSDVQRFNMAALFNFYTTNCSPYYFLI